MDLNKYPYVIAGAGFFGCVIAERIASELRQKVLIIEKRDHIGGNCHSQTDAETGIEYHTYGTHIFHTSETDVWNYIQKFTKFNNYFHQVLTTFQGKVYQMPINLETINSFYAINLKPFEVKPFLQKEIEKENIKTPANFEEKAVTMIGRPLYEAFMKGYTIKQWQRHPKELPANILTRLPFRTNYYESYFDDTWQGVPVDGFTEIFNRMLGNKLIKVQLNTDFFDIHHQIPASTKIIYTGPIDRFFDYRFGALEWRTLIFEREIIHHEDYQGTSVMNYADEHIPYTRIHEPRHLHPERKYRNDETIIIKEFSITDDGMAPYYPINDQKNQQILKLYHQETEKNKNVIFNGRLGSYKYLDMHQTIGNALQLFEEKLKPEFYTNRK